MQKITTLALLLLTLHVTAQKRKSPKAGKANAVVQINVGSDIACALVDGKLWCWGQNPRVLGDTINRISGPVRVASGKTIKAITCSMGDLMALDEKGTAWGWGDGGWFENGTWQAPNSPVLDKQYSNWRNMPVKLFDSIQWSAVDIADNHFAGIKTDGTLWVVGWDECRVFGNTYYPSPTQIGKGHTWINVGLGNIHGVALTNDQKVWTWGNNLFSQLGLGKMRTRKIWEDCNAFQPVAPGEQWKMIAVSTTNAVAIRQDGSLWFWGDSAYDVFNPKFALIPTRIGGDAIWTSASAGENHTLAIREDGSLWAIGKNEYGELGNGTTTRQNQLVRIGNDNDWVQVKTGINFSIAAKKDGTVWTWGRSDHGLLGDVNNAAINTKRLYPQQVKLNESSNHNAR